MQSVAVIIGFKSTFRVSFTNHVIAEVKVSFLPPSTKRLVGKEIIKIYFS